MAVDKLPISFPSEAHSMATCHVMPPPPEVPQKSAPLDHGDLHRLGFPSRSASGAASSDSACSSTFDSESEGDESCIWTEPPVLQVQCLRGRSTPGAMVSPASACCNQENRASASNSPVTSTAASIPTLSGASKGRVFHTLAVDVLPSDDDLEEERPTWTPRQQTFPATKSKIAGCSWNGGGRRASLSMEESLEGHSPLTPTPRVFGRTPSVSPRLLHQFSPSWDATAAMPSRIPDAGAATSRRHRRRRMTDDWKLESSLAAELQHMKMASAQWSGKGAGENDCSPDFPRAHPRSGSQSMQSARRASCDTFPFSSGQAVSPPKGVLRGSPAGSKSRTLPRLRKSVTFSERVLVVEFNLESSVL